MNVKPWRFIAVILGLAFVAGTESWAQTSAASSDKKPEPLFEQHTLFKSGEGGYHTYRIPALVVTKRGTVLAFGEARKKSGSDAGDIDLALRRIEDGGRTWGKTEIIADDGEHTMGNPCPVVDKKTGTIWLPLCRNNKQIVLMKSDDDGKTWTKPVEITRDAKNPAWPWVGTGPGHGIQLSSGRLLIPCWADAKPRMDEVQLSYAFYSDDAGKSWKRGAALDHNASDECEAVELTDGTLYMTARSRQKKKQRAFAYSKDGGQSWSPVQYDARMPELSCQGSVIRFSDRHNQDRDRILVAAPASQKDRTQLTVRLSYDETKTWPVSKVVHAGSAAYSDLVVNAQREALLFYEADNYSKLTLARFNIEWLTGSKDGQ